MKLGVHLTQRLEQVLSPQLILNLKLLQVPTLELEAMIRKELEENPALERADEPEERPAEGPDEPAPAAEPQESAGAELRPGEDGGLPESTPVDEYDVGDLFPDDGYLPSPVSSGSDRSVDAVELVAGPGPDLRAALLPQLRAVLPDEDFGIAEVVVESLDDDGFLVVGEEELAATQAIDSERLQAILHVIRRIEPGGIGCRDQRGALLVQLELAGCSPESLEYVVVAEHWDLLLKKRVDKIARLCRTGEEEVRSAVTKILTLEPRPARKFSSKMPEYVSPDFAVVWRDGKVAVEANEDSFPRLRLSRRYVQILRDPKAFSDEQVRFAREKFRRAMMFLRGIESRRQTLRRLMDLIVAEQHDFFLRGPQFLKPATLRDAAEKLGVHPSTASRATTGKYVETCYGIFPLKHFFKAGSGDKSRASIKQRIKNILENEDSSRPLSDDEVCAILKRESVEVARRTVAKYRNELRIPSRSQRRKL